MDKLRELPRQWVNVIRYGNELGPVQERYKTLFNQSVDRYRSFYQLPEYITDKAKNVDVYLVTRHQLNTFIAREFRNEFELLRRADRWHPIEENMERQLVDSNIKLTQELSKQGLGFTFPLMHRTAVLIAKEQERRIEETIDHEALHVLSSRALKQGAGFHSGTESFYPGGPSEGLIIDEVMTEALRLVAANSSLSVSQLNELVEKGQVWFGYKNIVGILFGLLTRAEGNSEKSFNARAQAPLYFGFDNTRVVDARRQFMANLEGSLSNEDRDILHQKIHKESSDYSTLGDLKANTHETQL